MFKKYCTLLFLLFLIPFSDVRAELVLVANLQLEEDSISREEAINIYMGRLRRFPSGAAAQPLDLPANSAEKGLFYRLLVNKDLSDIDAYWARLVFSGRASPPRAAANPQEVIARVVADRNTIGYIDSSHLDEQVKVILTLPDGNH